MADLKILNLNKRSDKFFSNKKLKLRRKSKRVIIKESVFMFSFATLIIYLNYLIPNKNTIFDNFFINLNKLTIPILDLLTYLYEICLAIFIVISLIFALILILGGVSRLLKISRIKSKPVSFK